MFEKSGIDFFLCVVCNKGLYDPVIDFFTPNSKDGVLDRKMS